MANVSRTAKSGSSWTTRDLTAYNIIVTEQTPEQSFGQHFEPEPALDIDPAIITSHVDADNLTDDAFRYLTQMDLASTMSKESFIDVFSYETLRLLGFANEPGVILNMGFKTSLRICHENRYAEANICLLHRRPKFLFILQENKLQSRAEDIEPQVIAEAIVAYQHNNKQRRRNYCISTSLRGYNPRRVSEKVYT